MELDRYRELGENVKKTVIGYLRDNSGWTLAKKSKDITIERKPTPCVNYVDGFLYRGQVELHCSKDVIVRYIDPLADGGRLRRKWDKDVNELNMLQSVDTDMFILQTLTNSAAMGLISPREFVDILVKTKIDEGLVSCGVSLDYPSSPPKAKYVRGWNHPCGNLLLDVPGKPDHTLVMNFIQPDIKGNIPKSIFENALPASMTGFFTGLKDILKKDGHLKS